MITLWYHEVFFRLSAPRCPDKAAGAAKRSVGSGSDNARGCPGLSAVSLKKPHDIVILSFCYAVKGQAIFLVFLFSQFF